MPNRNQKEETGNVWEKLKASELVDERISI